jgi:uncharacterized phage-associated protein
MISALDVAWYFVQKGNGDSSITQLKLQKLCYYAQGFYLANYGISLFSEAIEAWDYGPVIPELREIHSHRGADKISPKEAAFGNPISDMSIIDILDKVWIQFGYHRAGKLVDMTHAESPWIEAYAVGRNTKISEIMMLRYFVNHTYLNNENLTTAVYGDQIQKPRAVNEPKSVASANESLYDSSKEIRELAQRAAKSVMGRDYSKNNDWIENLAQEMTSFDD